MRWFKCLLLCCGHILLNLSLAFVTFGGEQSENNNRIFWKWFSIAIVTAITTVVFGAYLIALPIFNCLKKSKFRAYLVSVVVFLLYIFSLGIFLWALQHLLKKRTVEQCYYLSGQIGLVFGLLLLYDNMKGESTADLYERVLDELDDELEFGNNKVGIEDDDVQRS